MVWYRLRVLGSVSTHMSQQKCRVHVYTCNAPFPWVFTWSPNMHCMFRQWKYYESKKKPWFLQFSSVNKSKAFQDMLNTWYNNKIFFYCRAKGLGPKIRTQKTASETSFSGTTSVITKGICLREKQGHTVPWLTALKTLIYIEVLRFFTSSQQSIISLNTNNSNIYRLYTKS